MPVCQNKALVKQPDRDARCSLINAESWCCLFIHKRLLGMGREATVATTTFRQLPSSVLINAECCPLYMYTHSCCLWPCRHHISWREFVTSLDNSCFSVPNYCFHFYFAFLFQTVELSGAFFPHYSFQNLPFFFVSNIAEKWVNYWEWCGHEMWWVKQVWLHEAEWLSKQQVQSKMNNNGSVRRWSFRTLR